MVIMHPEEYDPKGESELSAVRTFISPDGVELFFQEDIGSPEYLERFPNYYEEPEEG